MTPTHPPGGPAERPPLRVLVADDSTVTRRVLRAHLSTLWPDVVVREAADGPATEEALAAGDLDLAFVDLRMPGQSGSQAVIRARRRAPLPLILFITETPDEELEAEAREAEGYELLQKPVDEDELRAIASNLAAMRVTRRVLVVDDMRTARRLVSRVLAECGFAFEVDAVDGGEIALESLQTGSYDIVLLDYDMPGLDGLETLCLIQETRPDLPVVMISASRNPAVERAARYFGARAFLRKPFFAADVERVMHALLGLPRTSLMADPEPAPSEDGAERSLAS